MGPKDSVSLYTCLVSMCPLSWFLMYVLGCWCRLESIHMDSVAHEKFGYGVYLVIFGRTGSLGESESSEVLAGCKGRPLPALAVAPAWLCMQVGSPRLPAQLPPHHIPAQLASALLCIGGCQHRLLLGRPRMCRGWGKLSPTLRALTQLEPRVRATCP